MRNATILAMALVLGLTACEFSDEQTSHDCAAFDPPIGNSCTFAAPDMGPTYACPNLKYVIIDSERLPVGEAIIECFDDGTGRITVLRDDCADHFVGACIN